MLYNNNVSITYSKEIVMIRRNFRKAVAHRHNNNFGIIMPEEIEVDFEYVIGHREAKRELSSLLDFLQNPEEYKKQNLSPYCKYLLVGRDGVGKSTLVLSIAKTAKIPVVSVEPSFYYNTENLLEGGEQLFSVISKNIKEQGNCILFLKNVEHINAIAPEVIQPFLEKLLCYFRKNPQLVAFASLSTSVPGVEVPRLLMEKPAFDKLIPLDPPELKVREQILEEMLKGIPIDETFEIRRLALDTYQMTPGEIKKAIHDARLYCLQREDTKVLYSDFAEVLARGAFGYAREKLDGNERWLTAIHEVGHVVAGYFSSPETFEVSKIEITPRSMYLGVTQETVDESKRSLFRDDLEKKIIFCLGGMACEEYYYGKTTSGVENDLEEATMLAIQIVKVYGMSEKMGPICLLSDYYKLENLEREADIYVKELLKDMYRRAKELIAKNIDAIEELTKALLDNEVLYSEEVTEILERYKENNK